MVAVGLMLGGCAPGVQVTYEGYRQHVEPFVGLTTDAVQKQWGMPDRILPLSDGRALWIYRTVHHYNTDETSHIEMYKSTEIYTAANGKNMGAERTDDVNHNDPAMSWSANCETRFVIGLDGKVQRFTFEGQLCTYPEAAVKKAD